MLSRGCKIKITKSSAVKKQHPKIGSEGFLNSLYLIPAMKIGIGNAYFFKYGKEDPCRVERRPFCIDLGMNSNTKNTLNKRRTKLEVLVLLIGQEIEIVSLLPACVSINNTTPFIASPTEPLPHRSRGMDMSGEMALKLSIPNIKKAYDTRSKKKTSGRPYLPIVDFEIVPHVESIASASVYEFKSWFNAMQAFVQPFTYDLRPEIGIEENVQVAIDAISRTMGFRHTNGLFELVNKRSDLTWDLDMHYYPDDIRDSAALQIRHLQAIHRVYTERSESDVINSLNELHIGWRDLARVIFGRSVSDRRFSLEFKNYNQSAKRAGLILRAYLVRSLLFNNIDYQVKKLSNIRAFRHENIPLVAANMRAIASSLRKEVPSSVAALDRLMKARGLLN